LEKSEWELKLTVRRPIVRVSTPTSDVESAIICQMHLPEEIVEFNFIV